VAVSHVLKEFIMAIVKAEKTGKPRNKNHQSPSRMNFRLAPEVKARVARAAALAGQDLTEFAVAALSEKADETIEKQESVFLSRRDHKFFLEVLDGGDRSEPSEKSSAAADRYRRGKKTGARYRLAD